MKPSSLQCLQTKKGAGLKETEKTYYFIDINVTTLMICKWGVSQTATHTGDTDKPDVHRMFIPKGQYNKLVRKLEKVSP